MLINRRMTPISNGHVARAGIHPESSVAKFLEDVVEYCPIVLRGRRARDIAKVNAHLRMFLHRPGADGGVLDPTNDSVMMAIEFENGTQGSMQLSSLAYICARARRKPLIAVGSYTARVLGFLLPLAPNITWAGAVMSLRSLGFNIMMPAFRALRADLVPPHVKGRVFGLFGTAFTAGSVIGPIVSTWIYSTYRFSTFGILGFQLPGYGIPFFINAVLGVLATTGVILLIQEPERKTAIKG